MRNARLAQALVALLLAHGASGAQAFELRGFRGLYWGDAPTRLAGAQQVSREGDVSCYVRERENLLFGDTPVTGVRYCFRQDRLFRVEVQSAVALARLSGEMHDGYGAPDVERPGYARWGVAGSPLIAEVTAGAGEASAALRLEVVGPIAEDEREELQLFAAMSGAAR